MLTHEGLELVTHSEFGTHARPDVVHKDFKNAIPHIYENSCKSILDFPDVSCQKKKYVLEADGITNVTKM